MSGPALDLLALDRDVRGAAARLEQWTALLRAGTEDARAQARVFDPWEDLRHTATQGAYRSLVELEASAFEAPLRDGLVRWVYELLQARVGSDLSHADAEAESALDPRLTKRQTAALKQARGVSTPEDEARTAGEAHTYREAFAEIVASRNDFDAERALRMAGELAAPVAAVRKERRARRWEVARRLGLAHSGELASKLDVGGLARALLDATEPLAVELFARARKRTDVPFRASSAFQLALGRDANEGWPAHLGARWLDDAFHALAPRGVGVGPFGEPLGSASFLRAASAWGFVWKVSGTPRSMPFGLARDPYPAPAYRFGHAIASVVAQPAFQARVLELPRRAAATQTRVLRTTMFLRARVIAGRAVLAASESIEPSTFEEITSRIFGAPLPSPMRDAWPEPRVDEPARLIGLLGTQAFVRDLVERFDEDWFRNPKAGHHLVSLACGPAFDLEPLDPNASSKLARAFEDSLG